MHCTIVYSLPCPSLSLAPPSPLPLPLPQLRVTSAPTYFHFPASGKRQPEDTYSASRHGIGAEALSKWVAERTDVHVSDLFVLLIQMCAGSKSLCMYVCLSESEQHPLLVQSSVPPCPLGELYLSLPVVWTKLSPKWL